MKKNGFSYFLRVTTEKYLNSTYGLICLNISLFYILPISYSSIQSSILKSSMALFLINTFIRLPMIIYFYRNKEKISWDFQDAQFKKFFTLILITGTISSLSMGLVTVGSIIEFGQQNLFTSMLLIISGAMILIGANTFSFTKSTVILYIGSIFSPIITYMLIYQNYQLIGYWGLLIVFGIMSVNQIFSSRTMMLDNIQMNNFNQSQVEYYKSILESVPGLVTIFTSNLEYEMINSRVTEFTGLTDQDLIGKKLGFTSVTPALEKVVMDFQKSYLSFNQTKIRLKGAHTEKWFMIAMHKIKSTGQIAVVSIDIDAQVNAEEKNLDQRAMVETSARMAAIGQMAAGIAHEINNPLAVITTKADQVLRRLKITNDEKNIYDVSKIQSTAFRIANIVKGLKSLSRDGEKDSFTDVPVEDFLNDISILFEEKMRTHQIHLTKNIPLDLMLECRSIQISQVVMNLVSNSIDAIQNLEEKWIKVEAVLKDQHVSISVTDSGSGIPNEILSKLMTPFFTTKPAGLGTGLGLSISKRIITDHGGQFYYDHASANTRFIIMLPQKYQSKKSA